MAVGSALGVGRTGRGRRGCSLEIAETGDRERNQMRVEIDAQHGPVERAVASVAFEPALVPAPLLVAEPVLGPDPVLLVVEEDPAEPVPMPPPLLSSPPQCSMPT